MSKAKNPVYLEMDNRNPQSANGSGKDPDHITEVQESEIIQGLDHPMQLDDVILKPNAAGPERIFEIANRTSGSFKAAESIVGTNIDPGKIGIVSWNGFIQVVPPGRFILPNPRASWKGIRPLTDNPIQCETLTIVRVQRGELGLAKLGGTPLILAEGLHVYNDRLFEYSRAVPVNQHNIQHGSIHIIRVPKGSYAAVTENNVPKLLPEGIHVTNSNVFKFDGMQSANQVYIQHGTLHILRVEKGNVALVTDNNVPKLLPEGTHYVNSNTFNYYGMQDLNQQVIKHGTITRFRVRKGEIGLCWENNQPEFFEEGIYEKDSANFQFERCVDASDKVITLGAKKILTVWDGEVGVSYRKGRLLVLKPSRHVIELADHVFQGFLSTQQQCLHLYEKNPSAKQQQGQDAAGLLVCETKDFVGIGIKADVFFRIVDPERVLLVVGKDSIVPLVRETSVATLNGIIRSTSLAEVAQSKEVAAKSEKQYLEALPKDQPSAPLFFDKVHDEFISKLHDSFIDKYGIEITNIRIESFKILNEELSSNISKQALTTAQTETQLANLAGQTEIATAQQLRDAEVLKIRVQSEATRLQTETDARNAATMNTAKTESEATLIRARADADSLMVRAEADAKAIRLKAQAEGERARLLDKKPLGGQIAMFQLYTDMVQRSTQGVEKIVYLGEGTNNPLNVYNLSTLLPNLALGQPVPPARK